MNKHHMDQSDYSYAKQENRHHLLSFSVGYLFLCVVCLFIGYTIGFSRGEASERGSTKELQVSIMEYVASASSDSDSDASYDNGYSDGYSDAEANFSNAYNDGYNDGVDSGSDDGYIDGYAEGIYDVGHLLLSDSTSPFYITWWRNHTGLPPVSFSEHNVETQLFFSLFLPAMPYSDDLIGQINPYTETIISSKDDYYSYLWSYSDDLSKVTGTERWYNYTPRT